MGQVISILQSKGGAGKSTLAIALAGLVAAEGARIAIVDTDRQASAAKWAEVEDESRGDIDHVEELSDVEITDLLRNLKETYDYVLVDTAGFDSRISGFVMGDSDLVLIPAKATVPDAAGAIATAKAVQSTAKMIRREIPFIGVYTDVDKNTKATRAIREQLDSYGQLPFADAVLWHSTSFKDAVNSGTAVKGRAREMTRDLIEELREKKLIPAAKADAQAA